MRNDFVEAKGKKASRNGGIDVPERRMAGIENPSEAGAGMVRPAGGVACAGGTTMAAPPCRARAEAEAGSGGSRWEAAACFRSRRPTPEERRSVLPPSRPRASVDLR